MNLIVLNSNTEEQDYSTIYPSVKQQIYKFIADHPKSNYVVIQGSDNKEYIYKVGKKTTLIRVGLSGVEKRLTSDNKKAFKKNLDDITKEEVKMVRAYNKITKGDLQKTFFEVQKAQRLDRDLLCSQIKIGKLMRELEEEKMRAERLEDQTDLTDWSKMKKMNEHLNNVGFYKGKPYYNETKEFYGVM